MKFSLSSLPSVIMMPTSNTLMLVVMILVIISDVTEGRKYHGLNQHHIANDKTRRLSPKATDPTTYYQIKANYYRMKAKKSRETTHYGCYRGGQCAVDDNLCCDCTIDEATCDQSSGYWSKGCVDICGAFAPVVSLSSKSSSSSSSSKSSSKSSGTGRSTKAPSRSTKAPSRSTKASYGPTQSPSRNSKS
eukprot:CAMPEP_0170870686 /NCGR_PEP_ID=MMETSP0734-20130129/25264_1 /TAXON_ID=186038 /ORGANISM="Fragilariopsis kerguelensis, Strain L26-C5" /LENGTH=189 /DNA_ID=CAMNT_0011249619 /DNA_START=154 /DNA_END=723 /DNA_ORIENTATION=-